MIDSVKILFEELNSVGITYCHWKSNNALDRTYDGLNDIDLLVDRRQNNLLYQILLKLGYKRVIAPWFKYYTAVENHISNSSTDEIIHLHLHYQLILGEKTIKGYRIPYESELLSRSTSSLFGALVPKKEDEVIILIARIFLKFGFVSILKKLISKEKAYFPKHIIEEFSFLKNDIDEGELEKVKAKIIPGLSKTETNKILNQLSQIRLFNIYRIKRKIKKDLKHNKRYSKHGASIKSGIVSLTRRSVVYKPFKTYAKKSFETGGISIALMGIDGAGKSTILKEIESWLKPQGSIYPLS